MTPTVAEPVSPNTNQTPIILHFLWSRSNDSLRLIAEQRLKYIYATFLIFVVIYIYPKNDNHLWITG